jgi:hypothetical protein
MAYRDVPSIGRANGKTILLLHGENFSGTYWQKTDDGARQRYPAFRRRDARGLPEAIWPVPGARSKGSRIY